MSTGPDFDSPDPALAVTAAAVAACAAMGTLWAVAALFQSRGAPMERLLAAERACKQHAFQSERIACMNREIAASRPSFFSSFDVVTYQYKYAERQIAQ